MQINDLFGAAAAFETVRMPDGTEAAIPTEHAAVIYVNEQPAFRVVCTPQLLPQLALGRLLTEGWIASAEEVEQIAVCTEGLKISVHGTKFNVRTAADRSVSVSLIEGSVSLDTGSGSRRLLRPGEIACYDPDTRKVVIGRGNVAMESCWAAGKLAFDRQPLGEICRYMARWYDTEIHITPALARNYAYTFTITDEPLEAILRIMSRINPIVYTFSDNRSVSISEVE